MKVLIVLGALALTYVQGQTTDKDTNCLPENFRECFKEVPLSFLRENSTRITLDELNDGCEKLKNGENCVKRFVRHCHADLSSMFKAAFAGLDYICQQPRQEVIYAIQCTMDDEANLHKCLQETLSQSTNFLQKPYEGTNDERKLEMCSAVNETESCMEEVAEHDCGKKAARLFKAFYNSISGVVQRELDCEGGEGDKCGKEKIEECFGSLMTDKTFVGMVNVDAESLDNTCQSFENTQQCMEVIQDECDTTVVDSWKSMRDSIAFICSQPRQQVLSHMNCLNDHKSDVDKCINVMFNHSSKIITQEDGVENDEVCRDMMELEECVEVVEEKECSRAAQRFYRTFFAKLSADCQEDKDNETETCVGDDFQKCFNAIPLSFLNENTTQITLEQLNTGCQKLEEGKECVMAFMQSCHEDISSMWTATLAGLDYLCQQPRQDVLNSIQCTLNDKANLHKCIKNTISQSTEHLRKDFDGTDEARKADMCSSVDETEKCMEEVEAHDCGQKAARMFKEFFDRITAVMKNKMACQDDRCGKEKIEGCFGSLMTDKKFVGMVNVDAESLDETCQSFENTQQCMKEIQDECDTTVVDSWKSMRDSIAFICSQPRQQVLSHMNCLNDHKSDVDKCINVMFNHSSKIITQEDGVENDEVCRDMMELEECVEVVEEKECSRAAQRFYRTFFAKLSADCQEDKDNETETCVGKDFQKCFNAIPLSFLNENTTQITLEQLNTGCQKLEEGKECVMAFMQSCHEDISSMWTATLAGLDYLCQQPRQDVLNSIQCTLNDKANLHKCIKNTISQSTEHLRKDFDGTDEARKADMCSSVDETEKCMEEVEAHDCGQKAARMFKEFYDRITAVMKNKMACQDDQCGREKIEGCFGSLMTDKKFVGMVNVDAESLDETCQSFENTQQCMKAIQDECDTTVVDSWKSMRDSIAFICSQPRQQVLSHMNCLNDHKSDVDTCINVMFNHSSKIITQEDGVENDEVCRDMMELEECVEVVEEKECSRAAQRFYRTFFAKLSADCQEDKDNETETCVGDDFQKCFNAIPLSFLNENTTQITLEKLNTGCQKLEEGKECVMAFMQSCHEDISSMWTATLAGLDYLCQQPRQDVLNTIQCTVNDKANLHKCIKNTISQSTEHLRKDFDGTDEARKADMCSSVDETEKCMEEVEAHDCGQKAARMFKEFYDRITAVMKNKMACQDDRCGKEKIEGCFGSLMTDKKFVGMVNVDAESLDETCQSFENTQQCMKAIQDECDTTVVDSWKSMRDSIAFICSQPRQQVLSHMNCLNDHKSDVDKCINVMFNHSSKIITQEDGVENDEVCRDMMELEECVEVVEEKECSRAAQRFYRTFFAKLSADCQEDKDNETETCVGDDFQKCFNAIPLSFLNENTTQITLEQLNTGCQKLEEGKECVMAFMQSCHEDISSMWTATLAGLDYLCQQPRQDVLNSIQCTLNDKANLHKCIKNTISQSTEHLRKDFDGTDEARKADMCSSVDETEKCMEEVEAHDCGQKAARMFKEFYDRITAVMKNKMACQDDQCGREKIEGCFGSLMTDKKFVGMVNVDAESLDETCQSFENTQQCMKAIQDECDTTVVDSWKSMRDSIAFICSQPRQQVLSHMNCLNDHKSDVDTCINVMFNHSSKIITQEDGVENDEVCRDMMELEECVEVVEEKECSRAAQRFYRTFFAKLSADCQEDKDNETETCVADDFKKCFNAIPLSFLNENTTRITLEQLNSGCQKLEEGKECVMAFMQSCHEDISSMWTATLAGLDYLCQQPRQDVLNTIQCTLNEKANLHKCIKNTISQSTEHLRKDFDGTDEARKADMCRSVDDTEKCMEEVEAHDCGQKAARMFKEFYDRITAVTKDKMGCVKTPVPPKTKTCVADDFKKCFNAIPLSFLNEQTTRITLQQLNTGCQKLEEGKVCVMAFMQGCHEDISSMWMATLAGLDYLCQQPRQDVLNTIQCTLNDKANLHKCIKNTITQSTEHLRKDFDGTNEARKADMCRSVDETEKCMEEVEAHDCGQKAARMFKEFYDRITAVTKDKMGCGKTSVPPKTKTCVADDFKKCFNAIPLSFLNEQTTRITLEQLNTGCQKLEEGKVCVMAFMQGCHEDISSMWTATLAGLDYLCQQPRRDVLNTIQCTLNDKANLHKCIKNTITQSTEHLRKDFDGTNEARKADMCRSVDETEKCMEEVEAHDCGQKAARMFKEFYDRITAVTKDKMGCGKTSVPPKTKTCVADDFKKCFNAIPLSFLNEQTTRITLEQLNTGCQKLEEGKVCVMAFMQGCHEDISSMWTATLAGLDYLCQQPRRDVLNTIQCTLNDKANLHKCIKNTITQSTEHLRKDFDGTNEARKADMCRSVDETEKCMEEVEAHDCGQKAARMFKEFYDRITAVTKDKMGCGKTSVPPKTKTCVADDFKKCFNAIPLSFLNEQTTRITLEQLNTGCQKLEEGKVCVMAFMQGCHEDISSMWTATLAGLDYLCQQPRRDVLNTIQCTLNDKANLHKCIKNTITQSTEHLRKDFDGTNEARKADMCRSVDETEKCMEEVEAHDCGQKAARMFKEFYDRITAVTKDKMGCGKTSVPPKTKTCVADDFKKCFNAIPLSFLNEQTTRITLEQLNTGCQKLEEGKVCVMAFMQGCHEDISSMWTATLAGLDYLCQQPRRDVLNTIQCTLNDKANLHKCIKNTITQSTEHLRKDFDGTNEARKADMCRSVDETEKCMEEVEAHDCGQKAARMFKEFYDRITAVTKDKMGCGKTSVPPKTKTCVADDFKKCFNAIPLSFLNEQTTRITLEQLNTGCQKLEEGKECVMAFMQSCHEDISSMWTATLAGLDYLCQQSRQDVLNTIQCTLNDKANLHKCIKNTISQSTEHLRKDFDGTDEARKADMCSSVDETEKCMEEVEAHDCGQKAARMFKEFYDRITAVTKDKMGCGKTSVPPKTKTCVADDFKKCFNAIPLSFLNEQMTRITLAQLNTGCQKLEEGKECVMAFMQSCHQDISSMWTATLAGLDYLCQQPRRDVLNTIQCTLNDKANLQKCIKNTITKSTQHLRKDFDGTDEARKADMCRSVDDTEKCMEEVEAHDCGQKAARMFKEFYDRITAVTKDKMGCEKSLATSKCQSEQFKQCFGKISPIERLFSNEKYSLQQFNSYCIEMEEMEKCVKKFEDSCHKDVSAFSKSLFAGMRYLCRKNRLDVVQYLNCFKEHRPEFQQCLETSMKQQHDILRSDKNDSFAERKVDMCLSMRTGGNCILKIEGRKCGEKAGQTFGEMFNLMNDEMNKRSACPLNINNCHESRFSACMPKVSLFSRQKVTADDVIEYCASMKKMQDCQNEFSDKCSESTQGFLEAHSAGIKKICQDSKPATVAASLNCLNSHGTSTSKCMKRHLADHKSFVTSKNRDIIAEKQNKEFMCRVLKNSERCVLKTEGKYCNGEEARVVTEYLMAFNKVLKEYAECSIPPKAVLYAANSIRRKLIIGLSTGAAVAVLIVIAIVACCLLKNKRKDLKEGFGETKSNMIPTNLAFVIEKDVVSIISDGDLKK